MVGRLVTDGWPDPSGTRAGSRVVTETVTSWLAADCWREGGGGEVLALERLVPVGSGSHPRSHLNPFPDMMGIVSVSTLKKNNYRERVENLYRKNLKRRFSPDNEESCVY